MQNTRKEIIYRKRKGRDVDPPTENIYIINLTLENKEQKL